MEDPAMRCTECESALAFHRALSKTLTCSHRDLRAKALTPLHYDLLLTLKIAPQGNGFDLRSLAKRLGVRRSAVSGAIEELHVRRLIYFPPGSKQVPKLSRAGDGLVLKLARMELDEWKLLARRL